MSIVPLLHATLVMPRGEETAWLARVQALGCLHVIGYDGPASIEIDERIRVTRAWLATSPRQHHRVQRMTGFDPGALVMKAETLRERHRLLAEEREAILQRIRAIAPWGHFRLPELGGHAELRLWFYHVPPARMALLAGSDHVWCRVGRTLTTCFVVVVAADEPVDLPFPRVHVGDRPLARLEERLAEIEVEIDDIAAERASLTRWSDLFDAHVDRLLDGAARDHAAVAVGARGMVRLLAGWVPAARAGALREWAQDNGVALLLRPPAPMEEPPTLLANPELAAPGAMLVRFFTTPAYRAWDPSAVVMGAFTLFFAMILGDALYGAILCCALTLGWRAMGRRPAMRRLRLLAALLALGTTVWGVLTGSYAGLPPPFPVLEALQFVPAGDHQLLLMISLGTGFVHLILANLLAAWHDRRSATALARIGWAMIFGAAALWRFVPMAAYGLGGAGLFLVLLFTSERRHFGARLGEGVMALPKLVSVMGDTLSYLRLFALGLATASLAVAFNDLAASVARVPGTGVVLGALVLLFGHGINLLLGVAGGVIHGLRLNYIEFFGWSLWGDGRPFLPFERREKTGCTT